MAQEKDAHAVWLALGGLGGGLLGAVAGGGVGTLLYPEGKVIPEGTGPGIIAGYLLGVPLGVHVANGLKGNYPFNVLTSAGVVVGGTLLLASGLLRGTGPLEAVVGAGTVVLQFGVSIRVEQFTALAN